MNIRFILTSPAAAPAQTTVHRVKVITGGGGHRRATAEIGGRMQIVSGPAVERSGRKWCRRAGTGAEGAAGPDVMRYRVDLGALGGPGHGGGRLAKTWRGVRLWPSVYS